jgi:hypothetical protein
MSKSIQITITAQIKRITVREATQRASIGKQWSMTGISRAEIEAALGFKGQPPSEDGKSETSFYFDIAGQVFSVWDWHGWGKNREWSAFGPHDLLRQIFPTATFAGR